jgi:hypothetical protein
MERFLIKVSDLDEGWFRRYPVWTWAGEEWEEDLVRPVLLDGDLLPADVSPLMIRARFKTPGGLEFTGSIVFDDPEVYCIDFEIEGQGIGFNKRLKALADEDFARLQGILGGGVSENFFPIAFFTDFRMPSGERLEGEFQRPSSDPF